MQVLVESTGVELDFTNTGKLMLHNGIDIGSMLIYEVKKAKKVLSTVIARDWTQLKEMRDYSISTSSSMLAKEVIQNWRKNYFLNAAKIDSYPEPITDEHKDKPAIIIGSGPSLDKNWMDLLPLVGSEKAVLIGLNGSSRLIQPHYYMSCDYKGATSWYQPHLKNSIGVFSFDASPSLVEQEFKDYRFFNFASRSPLYAAVRLLHPSLTNLANGETTTYSALHFADLLGCNPIILVGLDCSYTKSRHHCNGQDESFPYGEDEFETMDINNNPVLTNFMFYTQGLHLLAACFFMTRRGKTVYNCTEGGVLSAREGQEDHYLKIRKLSETLKELGV